MTEHDRAVTAFPGERTVTNASSPAEKVTLFRTLFRGREDVYARRWENPKTGKSGYSPCCAVEWVRGVCGKASGKANCATCPQPARFVRETLTYVLTLAMERNPQIGLDSYGGRRSGSVRRNSRPFRRMNRAFSSRRVPIWARVLTMPVSTRYS